MAALANALRMGASLSALGGNGTPHAWLDSSLGLVLGEYPTPILRFDFVSEEFLPIAVDASPPTREKKIISLLSNARRIRSVHKIETPREIYEVGSATQMLVEGLNIIERLRPGTLSKLAEIKGRTKRPVALRREDLYDYPHPPEHSAVLESGYFVATNNKAHEALGFLKRAIRIAALEGDIVLHIE